MSTAFANPDSFLFLLISRCLRSSFSITTFVVEVWVFDHVLTEASISVPADTGEYVKYTVMNRQAMLGKAIKGEERIYGFEILTRYLDEVMAVDIIAEKRNYYEWGYVTGFRTARIHRGCHVGKLEIDLGLRALRRREVEEYHSLSDGSCPSL
ncbi:uncharacterized protein RSE6_14487 [Rhynchosporium secalis]|uniref:Uncharacterized protein n=1 Tax=Rhynchosporium secalis TaxID=38038 RepID=A0A1E1MVF0_RHYSE|nr:uncharacterized protein RSE6_14487 [Rhynchosporium secalis]